MLLYKYRGGDEETFERDLYSLEHDYFWAAKIGDLNDPCETFIDCDSYKLQLENAVKVLSSSNPKVIEALQGVHTAVYNIKKKVNDTGVFLLSGSYDDELLWAHYGNSHKGFCIEFDSNYLLRNINKNYFNVVQVHYSDIIPKLELEDIHNISKKQSEAVIQKFVGTKSLRWNYESEVRIVMDKAGKQQYDYRAVKSIYFGLRMCDEHKDKLMNHLKGRNIKYYQIKLESNSYRLRAFGVTDRYKVTSKYLYNVAPVMLESPVAIEDIKEEYKKYATYLNKAIEVARRDPYCAEVWFASFSFDRSTPANPVFLVNCKTTYGEFTNYYYSLNEIDNLYSEITDAST